MGQKGMAVGQALDLESGGDVVWKVRWRRRDAYQISPAMAAATAMNTEGCSRSHTMRPRDSSCGKIAGTASSALGPSWVIGLSDTSTCLRSAKMGQGLSKKRFPLYQATPMVLGSVPQSNQGGGGLAGEANFGRSRQVHRTNLAAAIPSKACKQGELPVGHSVEESCRFGAREPAALLNAGVSMLRLASCARAPRRPIKWRKRACGISAHRRNLGERCGARRGWDTAARELAA